MARYRGPKAKIARKFGENIFGSPKIGKIVERKNYPPGQHGQSRRRRLSNYAIQLREKQKIKYTYGLLEKQFRRYFSKAEQMKGETGINLLQLLERRLDNTVFRLGFAPTRMAARQLVGHKHILVNEKPVNIPSYLISPGDEIRVKDKSRKLAVIHDSVKQVRGDLDIPWLSLDKGRLSGKVVNVPDRDQLDPTLKVQLVVELFSK